MDPLTTEALNHVAIVTALLVGAYFLLVWRPAKKPVSKSTPKADDRCQQSFKTIHEAILLCQSHEQVNEVEKQADDFFYHHLDRTDNVQLKKNYRLLCIAIVTKRKELNNNFSTV